MSEPVLVALLFADRVIVENNGKKGVIGTFNNFFAQTFPAVFPSWGVYAAATNLSGKHEFALTLFRPDTNQVVMPINGQFDAKNRVDVVELIFQVNGVVFPDEGKYALNFNIDGELIGSRVLVVSKTDAMGPPQLQGESPA